MKLQSQIVLLALTFGLLAGSGCANSGLETPALAANSEAPIVSAEENAEPKVKPPEPEDYPVAPFEGDALYRLLVAEIAGYRRDFDTALRHYLAIAEETQDPGVAARATRLAAYLKKPDAELTAAQIWAEAEPENIQAHRHVADKLMRSGRLEAAILHMEAVRNLGGLANFEVFAYRAASLDAESKQGLLTALDALHSRHPDDSQILFARAVLLRQTGALEESLQLVDRLLADEIETDVVLLKVNVLKGLGRPLDASRFLEATIKEATSKEATINEASTQSTNSKSRKVDKRLRLIFARLLFDEARLNDARVQYELVLKAAPSDGNILFALALIAMEQKENDAAESYLRQMVRWNRRVGEAHFYLGDLAERREHYSAAIEEYRQVGRGYEYIPAQSRIARILVKQDKLKEMSIYLANARSDDPDNASQLVMIEAQLLADKGLSEDVFALLDGALMKRPDEIELLYFRGLTGQRFERLDIMERDLLKVIELEPNNGDALNALGYTLADQTERFDEAFLLIKRALELKPNEAAFIDSMGWVLYRLKDFDQAAMHLRRALELFVNDEVAAHLGEVLWVKGDRDEASAVWQKALGITPDSEILQKVIERFTGQ